MIADGYTKSGHDELETAYTCAWNNLCGESGEEGVVDFFSFFIGES